MPFNINETEKKIGYYALAVVGLVLLCVAIYLYGKHHDKGATFSNQSQQSTSTLSRSPVTDLKSNKETAALIKELQVANSSSTFKALDAMSKENGDKAQAQSLKLYAGASLIGIDRNAGAAYYLAIAKDLNNTPFVRAYALTQITRYASGDGNTQTLALLFDDPASIKAMSKDEVTLLANKKILEVFPMPGASAIVARLELIKTPTKENALRLRELYMEDIASGSDNFSRIEGLSHFVPGIYLSTARFLQESEKVGAASTTEVRYYYDKAFRESLQQAQGITKQFIMLAYLDYLLSKKMSVDADTLIKEFLKEPLTLMLVNNLKSTHGIDYPYILTYLKTKAPLALDLDKKIGVYVK